MRSMRTGTKAWVLSSALLFSCGALVAQADAAPMHHDRSARSGESHHGHAVNTHVALRAGARVSHAVFWAGRRFAAHSHAGSAHSYGISCVPYAREVSGIEVAGNAWQWWANAEGRYARGDAPEAGSVLNFRANGRMRLGHVAVVTRVVNAREIIVDHANWPGGGGRGGVSHGIAVVDVSEANNWSAVRVELGHGGAFGSVYPTYGFIYNRPDTGLITASIARPAPMEAINSVPSDLRPVAERPWHVVEEVAEAPDTLPRQIDLSVTPVADR